MQALVDAGWLRLPVGLALSRRAKGKWEVSVKAVEDSSHRDYRNQRRKAQRERWCSFAVEFFDVHAKNAGDKGKRKIKSSQQR